MPGVVAVMGRSADDMEGDGVTTTSPSNGGTGEGDTMPKYVIERTIPGAGKLTADELQGISQKSVEVLDGMAGRAQWLQSYVTGDKIYCVYIADDEAAVREHASCGGFPADSVAQVATIIDPTTAEVAV
jgi:hypothetical protein